MSLIIVLLFALLPQTPLVADVVDRIAETYSSKLKDFSADFVQISQVSSNQRMVKRGHLYLKRGKKMLFEYRNPQEEFYYSDGKFFTKYIPVEEQAVRTPIGKSDDELLQIFQILGNPAWKDQFGVKEELRGAPAGRKIARLTPNRKDIPVVVMEVDEKTFLMYRFEMTFPDGEKNEYQFSNIKTAPIDESIFVFKKPPGVQLIEGK